MNTFPIGPIWEDNAACVSSIPVSPVSIYVGYKSTINAVQLHITIVSVNTPKVCIKPCCTGWLTSAVAAALGADPIPASLENNPLFIPVNIIPPIVPIAISLIPNALSNINLNTPGT